MPSSSRERATKCEWWFCVAIDTTLSLCGLRDWRMDVFESPQKNRAFIRWHTYINRVYLFPLLVLLSSTLEKTFPSHLPKNNSKNACSAEKAAAAGRRSHHHHHHHHHGAKRWQENAPLGRPIRRILDANANDTFRGGSGGFGGGGFRGGGVGGVGGKGGGPTLKYERVVPKFLRHHADLLVGNALKGREDQNEEVSVKERRGGGGGRNATRRGTRRGDGDGGDDDEYQRGRIERRRMPETQRGWK